MAFPTEDIHAAFKETDEVFYVSMRQHMVERNIGKRVQATIVARLAFFGTAGSCSRNGDVVDPEGGLSGVSKPKGGNILQELSEIKRLENDIKERKREIQKIDQIR
uniref:Uncharacterized protein n=1 Tax=Glossina palpalis gambiensis TaxID=67801 RepID=A0A1B0BQM3_9MUSC